MLENRRAVLEDLKDVSRFTDWWLSGRAKAKAIPGAVNDCFISPSQHKKYILKYRTWLWLDGRAIVAWAVIEPSGTLIHMLVAGPYRGYGLGRAMMAFLKPTYVRSKNDQSSGDPRPFYEKCGYCYVCSEPSRSRLDIDKIKPTRPANIDILEIGRVNQ